MYQRDEPGHILTAADFPRPFTLKDLIVHHCDGDEAVAWERYFAGEMDEDVRRLFEGAVHPTSHTVAVIMRAAINEIKRAVGAQAK